MNAIARTGTTKKRFRPTRGPVAYIVDLVRRDGDRARFYLDDIARAELHPKVGERMALELYFDEPANDNADELDHVDTIARVTVTAVHERGFVDVDGYPAFIDEAPLDVLLRRYPERLDWKVS